MAYTTIDKPDDYFNTVLYTGTSASNAITVGFKPDLVWIKWRDGSNNHKLQDAIRGITKAISSNTTGAEVTDSPSITSFDTNGFTLGNDGGDYNYTGRTYASWNWLGANTTVSNTSGSITSTVSANTTSGFSIVSYTGNGTGNSTIGHGLGAIPKFIIVKNRSATGSWGTKNPAYNSPADPKVLYFDTGAADSSQNVWGTSASFTTLTFTVGDWSGSNTSSQNYIAYCFADTSMIKAGSYVGNNSANGTFVYTGFKPAFVMIKNSTTAPTSWVIQDTKRSSSSGGNPADKRLLPNASTAEATDSAIDLLSNGFKIRSTGSWTNDSANTYIYLAIAEQPFVTSIANGSIPATAR
jgi:hypothetical protein